MHFTDSKSLPFVTSVVVMLGLVGGQSGDLYFLIKAGSTQVPVKAIVVRKRPSECLQSTCLQPKHTSPKVWGIISYDSKSTLKVIPYTLTANLYVSLLIQDVGLPFMNIIQRNAFQQDNTCLHTTVVTQQDLTVSTCCLGLLDHQIFLQSSTHGKTLDKHCSIIHNQL